MAETEKDILNEEELDTAAEETAAQEPAEEAVDPRIAELEEELAKAKDQYLRLYAEYGNYRNRTQREKDALYVDVTAGSVLVLLPIMDNVERALAAENAGVEDMRQGFEMVLNSALTCFEKLGVTSFGEVGEDFDANIHNCIGMNDEAEVESGKIAFVLQKGYALGKKLIRPAMVQVKS